MKEDINILSVYRCIPINIQRYYNLMKIWHGKVVMLLIVVMRVIEHGKKNVGSERFDRRYQVKGTKEQADYENDLSFIWIQKWRNIELKLKLVRCKYIATEDIRIRISSLYWLI